MKVIDQTPLLDANGQLSLINRIQGMLKYGFSWPSNLEAQEVVIAQFSKVIEKHFTLFRNQQLGASEIVVPLILVGPSGIYAMDATPLKGYYRARGEEWGMINNERFQPASINLLTRTTRLAKILQLFLERQGLKLSAPVEPILLAANPGMQIDSVRPVVRPVMSDAIDRFAASLLSARPVYNMQEVNGFVERIQNPRSTRKAEQPPISPKEDPFSERDETPFPDMEPSRMQSILNSPQNDSLIETGPSAPPLETGPGEMPVVAPSDVDFALEDEAASPTVLVNNPPSPVEDAPVKARPAKRRIIGMTIPQILILLGIFLCWLVVMVVGVYFIILPQL